ncbi:MAG: sigma-54-dependent Fis family transcriptional regulator [Deltaproteobacteria bacterium]|nr:sigma-54-dependent Fis family transcriptional regulator [Deltaproteobacteria bacterium]
MTAPPDPRWQASPWSELLLDTWRQVSEHLELRACCEALWPRLQAVLPTARLWVRRVEPAHGWIETVAVAPWEHPRSERTTRDPLSPEALALLLTWALRGQVEEPPAALRALLLPRGGPLLAGGLVDGGEVVGVLLIEGDRVLLRARPLLQALLAPMVVALRNDRRVHELARLHEAAAADNRALLSRLARDSIGGAVVGASGGLREVMAGVQRVSQTEAPVLLLGDTGTGKELIAREVHARSPRASGPFLKVNCGAIPPELVDSELFGHERGSFTGAVANRLGWFERADGGTLFLDEIGELPLAAQVRLLRVLQDGSFERVGGARLLHADVRLVAATHRDLREMVADGRFREDLWYRVGVFPIRIPTLRERMDDLPALVEHFAARSGLRLHGRELSASPAELRALSTYPWPGNVRELGAVIERAAILGDGHRLDVRAALGVEADAAPGGPPERGAPPPSSLEAVNRAAVERALRACRGRIEGERGAAAILGLRPSTLRSRMKGLGLRAAEFRGA